MHRWVVLIGRHSARGERFSVSPHRTDPGHTTTPELRFLTIHIPIAMSANNSTDDSSFESATGQDDVPGDESTEDLHKTLGELRAEVTRLKAQQAKQQAKSWIERHPMLAVTLSSLLGAAAGYGAAVATRSSPPTLSEQARGRLRDLADEARRVASDVGRDLSTRAARSSQEARKHAQETGERLAKQAQESGEGVRRETQELLRRASKRAQRMGAEAGEQIRHATEEASEEARELGESLAEEAEETVEEQAESVRETLSAKEESSGLRRSLFAVAGLAAGGYLAAKVSRWL